MKSRLYEAYPQIIGYTIPRELKNVISCRWLYRFAYANRRARCIRLKRKSKKKEEEMFKKFEIDIILLHHICYYIKCILSQKYISG